MRPAPLLLLVAFLLALGPARATRAAEDRPNVIVILADDLGYGDLSSYGHPTIHTPHLDRMAAEGQRWTSFYAGARLAPSLDAVTGGDAHQARQRARPETGFQAQRIGRRPRGGTPGRL